MAEQQVERKAVEVAAGILIRKDGTILMGSRPEGKPYAGYWEFPGGKFEPGETAHEALARELREELDLDIGASTPWLVKVIDYPHARVRLHFRKCHDWKGEPRSMEHQQFGFYHRARLPAGELLPMDDLIAGWIELPRVAAWIPQKGGDIEARVVRAKEAGAGLIWVEGEKPVSSDSGWTGSFARSEAEVSLAAANRADFSFIRKGVTGLGEEHEIPVYLPAESASEAAAAEEAGAQGVWLEF